MTDFSQEAYLIQVSVCEAASTIAIALTSPHVLMKPAVYPDGNKWCALLGDDLMSGVCGFGDTPAEACDAFDEAWRTAIAPPTE